MADKYLLLQAEKHNWGLIGPGDWNKTIWLIYSDRSYEKEILYNRDREELKQIIEARDVHIKDLRELQRCVTRKGKIREKRFSDLQAVMASEPWRDPEVNFAACDGVAWQIEEYDSEHKIIHSSGDLGYIYGQPVLEAIVAHLP